MRASKEDKYICPNTYFCVAINASIYIILINKIFRNASWVWPQYYLSTRYLFKNFIILQNGHLIIITYSPIVIKFNQLNSGTMRLLAWIYKRNRAGRAKGHPLNRTHELRHHTVLQKDWTGPSLLVGSRVFRANVNNGNYSLHNIYLIEQFSRQ